MALTLVLVPSLFSVTLEAKAAVVRLLFGRNEDEEPERPAENPEPRTSEVGIS